MMDPFDKRRFPPSGHNSDDESCSAATLYSSCDGSDFDRYCSANSVLGTASVCSSITNRSELLDSLRSLGVMEDLESGGGGGGIRERIVTGGSGRNEGSADSGRFGCLSDVVSDASLGNGSYDNNVLLGGLDVASDKDHDKANKENGSLKQWLRSQHRNGDANNHENTSGTSFCLPDASEERDVSSKLGFQGNVHHQFQNSAFSDEDGKIDSGSDNEAQVRSYRKTNNRPSKPTNAQIIGSPMMDTVAFGENDWDDFVQETGGGDSSLLAFVPFYGDNSLMHSDNKKMLVESATFKNVDTSTIQGTYQENDARNMPLNEKGVLHVNKPFEGKNASKGVDENGNCEGCPDAHESRPVHGEYIVSNNAENAPKKYVKSNFPLSSLLDNEPVDFIPMEVLLSKESGNNGEFRKVIGEENETRDMSMQMKEKDAVISEIEKPGTDESFDDMFLEMEEILLSSGQFLRARNFPCVVHEKSKRSIDFRDGSSTASTSGANYSNSHSQFPCRIEWVEVVGVKQKKGNVSFGERLIGVKEHTVYRLHVWSGKHEWQVERRYRDFFSLYCHLKKLFSDHGLSLPSPWTKVDQESRKIFGNVSPHVVSERSSLIQDCLQSILSSRTPFGTPSSFVWFLAEGKDPTSNQNKLLPPSSQTSTDDMQSSTECDNLHTEDYNLGKRISLVVELKNRKSVRQLLEDQCYTCTGCHRHLDSGKTFVQELVQTLGWGKPRLCEYTGQLFCSRCHTNDTAVLPARILHHWDFSLYPVSQLAKAYIESIYDQPMLCVSAVNPFLFSKVPALRHVMDIRKKIGSMIPYIRCPFRRSIQKGLGPRRYLLQSNDFFAIRDLVDLSKGAFSALPLMVETISSKVLRHISLECLECYDVGIPCAAKEACKDPVSLILPFQETEAARCGACGSLFHQPCIVQIGRCPCSKFNPTTGARVARPETPDKLTSNDAGEDIIANSQIQTNIASSSTNAEADSIMNSQIQKNNASSSTGFFADIMSKRMSGKLWKPRNNVPVILMSSLPNNSL